MHHAGNLNDFTFSNVGVEVLRQTVFAELVVAREAEEVAFGVLFVAGVAHGDRFFLRGLFALER